MTSIQPGSAPEPSQMGEFESTDATLLAERKAQREKAEKADNTSRTNARAADDAGRSSGEQPREPR